jgi:hypothetical protein
VKASEEKDGQVDHEQASRHSASLAAESAAPVPLTKIMVIFSEAVDAHFLNKGKIFHPNVADCAARVMRV